MTVMEANQIWSTYITCYRPHPVQSRQQLSALFSCQMRHALQANACAMVKASSHAPLTILRL